MRRCLATALLLGLFACSSSDADEDEDVVLEPKERPTPRFLEPANGVLVLPVTRTADIVLQVSALTPGFTTLEIDGRSVGTLGKASEVGQLASSQLTLHMGGAMIPGRHTLQLVTPADEEPKRSTPVTVDLKVEPTGNPTLSELQGTGLFGEALAASGVDESGALLLVDETRAHVLAADGIGWSLEAVRSLELPGFHRSDTCLPAAMRLPDEAGDRLRLAWRVGLPGSRIDVLETTFEDDAPVQIVSAFELEPALVGAVEHAALDCPALRPRAVLAELLALTDAEHPRDGDRAIVSVAFLGDGLTFGLPKRLGFGEVVDLDHLGPVIDLAAPPELAPMLMGARMGQLWPVVIELDAASGTAALRASARHAIPALTALEGPMAMVTGGFGSRTIVARSDDRLSIVQIDDSTRSLPVVHELASIDERPSGAVAAAIVGGSPLFVVPMGADRPAYMVTSSAATPTVRQLDALRCDAVALPVARVANEHATTAVACLREGELHLATLVLG